MVNTGTVPIADAVHKMPSPSHAEREWNGSFHVYEHHLLTITAISSKPQATEEDEEEELRKLQAEMAM